MAHSIHWHSKIEKWRHSEETLKLSYGSGISNIVLSPLQTRHYLCSFIKWSLSIPNLIGAFMQGLFCHMLPGLSSSLEPQREIPGSPCSFVPHASEASTRWLTLSSSAVSFGWPLTILNYSSSSFCLRLLLGIEKNP